MFYLFFIILFGGRAGLLQSNRAMERSSARTIDRSRDRATDRATERPNEQATEQPSDRATEQPSDRATERPSDRAIERPNEQWSSDRASDRAIERSTMIVSRSSEVHLTHWLVRCAAFFKTSLSNSRPMLLYRQNWVWETKRKVICDPTRVLEF